MSWYRFIQKYFGFFFAAGMALGFFLPGFFLPVKDRVMLILGTVITLTFLTIDFRTLAASLKRFHITAAVLLISKAVLPFLLYRLARPLGEEISIGVLLLSLTPFAAVSPTITKILGGDTEFIVVNQVLQTLLAPLYMPFLLLLFAGAEVELNLTEMMKTLVFLIIIPFALSVVLKPFLRSAIEATKKYFNALNILLISLLLTGLLASAAAPVHENPLGALKIAGWVAILGVVMPLSGWFVFFFLDRKKRIGLSVATLYMNIGLTAVIAAGFFSPGVLLFVLIYELPANLFPSLLGRIFTITGISSKTD